jgi:hypothetical protein
MISSTTRLRHELRTSRRVSDARHRKAQPKRSDIDTRLRNAELAYAAELKPLYINYRPRECDAPSASTPGLSALSRTRR